MLGRKHVKKVVGSLVGGFPVFEFFEISGV
jgi:hypothetical protein